MVALEMGSRPFSSSPLVVASQTCSLIAAIVGLEGPQTRRDPLGVGQSDRYVQQHGTVMIRTCSVYHMPEDLKAGERAVTYRRHVVCSSAYGHLLLRFNGRHAVGNNILLANECV